METETSDVQLSNEMEQKTLEILNRIQHSPEIQAISRQINIEELNSLVDYGNQSAVEISRFSDKILNSIRHTEMEEAKNLTLNLSKIMTQFNLSDFESERKPNFFQKLFHKNKDLMEGIYKKYENMQIDVEKVGITLKKFEVEMVKENDHLETMFHHNLAYYEELQKYIIAGERVIHEITAKLIPDWEEKVKVNGNQLDQLKLQHYNQAKQMLEQSLYDLRLAENVALQSLPMIKLTQMGNDELLGKINASFIITLPLFRQALAQTVSLKRQQVRAKAQQALDERTAEVLRRNADNKALQEKAMTQLNSGNFIQLETLQKTWSTIMQGIEDVKEIYQNTTNKREKGLEKLAEFKRALKIS